MLGLTVVVFVYLGLITTSTSPNKIALRSLPGGTVGSSLLSPHAAPLPLPDTTLTALSPGSLQRRRSDAEVCATTHAVLSSSPVFF